MTNLWTLGSGSSQCRSARSRAYSSNRCRHIARLGRALPRSVLAAVTSVRFAALAAHLPLVACGPQSAWGCIGAAAAALFAATLSHPLPSPTEAHRFPHVQAARAAGDESCRGPGLRPPGRIGCDYTKSGSGRDQHDIDEQNRVSPLSSVED